MFYVHYYYSVILIFVKFFFVVFHCHVCCTF